MALIINNKRSHSLHTNNFYKSRQSFFLNFLVVSTCTFKPILSFHYFFVFKNDLHIHNLMSYQANPLQPCTRSVG